jgi:ubiquinone/menaquinone biosynthesis C-methylase UbiE
MSTDAPSAETRVRTEWMDDATAAAWRKWHDKSVRFWHELTHALLAVSQLETGQRVLDLASGTGDPAMTLAERVGPAGHVVATDLAPRMIEIARENARRAGLFNLSFDVVDAHALPFPEAAFDRVTCRLGVMYFWNCRRALEEVRRVLKPGGIAAFVAWGPVEQNEYLRAVLGPFKKRQPMPDSPPDAPQPYRFGAPGSLGAELRSAGFAKVEEETLAVHVTWPGPPEEVWARHYDVAVPLRSYFDGFASEARTQAIQEVIAGLTAFYDGHEVATRVTIVVGAAVK